MPDWKVHTPSNLWFALAAEFLSMKVKSFVTDMNHKASTINFLSNEDTSGCANNVGDRWVLH